MAKSYKSHRIDPPDAALAGAVVGPRRKPAKRVRQADLAAADKRKAAAEAERPKEIGGPSGPEPTRYGDWEIKGRCIDF